MQNISVNIKNINTINNKLRIGAFNCQGIKWKIEDPNFVKEVEKCDIFGVSETWICTNESKTINIPGYKFYPFCRKKENGRSRGGIGWFIKDNLRKGIKLLYNISNENFMWCKFERQHFKLKEDLFVCVVYIPPENSSREIRLKKEHFNTLIDTVIKIKSDNIILIGDFNARTKNLDDVIYNEDKSESIIGILRSNVNRKRNNRDTKSNKYGKKLIDYCLATQSYIANGRTLGDLLGNYTCYETNGVSTVDYAIIKENIYEHITKFTISTPKMKSDHCILNLELLIPDFEYDHNNNKSKSITAIKWDDKVKQLFLKRMQTPKVIHKIKEIEESFNTEFEKTNDEILDKINYLYTCNEKAKHKKTKHNSKKNNRKKWYDTSCYELYRKMKSLAKQCSKSPQSTQIRKTLIATKKQYKKLLTKKKIQWKEKILGELEKLESGNPRQYWDIIKGLQEDQKSCKISNPNKFETFFKTLFSNIPDKNNFHNEIEEKVKTILLQECSEHLNPEFIFDEFKSALNKLKNKTPGPDRIPAAMLKASPEKVLRLILKLINRIKYTKQYPERWSLGNTTLILKDGEEGDPNNYRAITICSAMAKIFSIMVNERLKKIVNEKKLICDNQIGFKEGSRTADHIFVLKNTIDNYLQDGKKIYSCFVDFKKAFDNVWRYGLYYKLLNAGVNCDIVKIIKSMYDKTQLCLKMNGNLSNPILAKKGVKQGCVLSSLLFNLFVNDIPSIFNKDICKPIKVGNILLSCLMYADDIVLLSESKEGIENCLNKLSEYTQKWMMEVNTTKSKIITFQKCGVIQKLNLTYDNKPLEQVKQFKYLGNIISNNGNFKENDKYLKNKGLRASFLLLKKIGLTYKPSAYIRLFEKTVEPIILYNTEVTRMSMPKKCT